MAASERTGETEGAAETLACALRDCAALTLPQALPLGTTVAHSARPLSSRGQLEALLRRESDALLLG